VVAVWETVGVTAVGRVRVTGLAVTGLAVGLPRGQVVVVVVGRVADGNSDGGGAAVGTLNLGSKSLKRSVTACSWAT